MTVKELINYLMEQPLHSEVEIEIKKGEDIIDSSVIVGFKQKIEYHDSKLVIQCE